MSRRSIFSITFGILLLGLVSAHNACNNTGFTAAGSGVASSSVGNPVPIAASGPKTFSVQLNAMNNISINLDDTIEVPVTVSSQSGFSGSVNITLDRSKLAAMDPNGDINITPAQVSVNLSAGGSQTVKVSISTKSTSLAGAGTFSLISTPVSTDYTGQVQLDLNLGVNPMYVVNVVGLINNVMVYDRPTTLTSFRTQSVPLTVRFINQDLLFQHIIHGTGLIIHQNVATPLLVATSSGPVPGGIYDVKVMPSNIAASGAYHCHIHGGTDHLMEFNLP